MPWQLRRTLLEGGAEVDALADMYGGHSTTMSMLVSSCHPAKAGVQVALVETLRGFRRGSGTERLRPMEIAADDGAGLRLPARCRGIGARGARVDNIAAAAGLGRIRDARSCSRPPMPKAGTAPWRWPRNTGTWTLYGCSSMRAKTPTDTTRRETIAHSTPLHQAALAGHTAVVQLLVERGARLDIQTRSYNGHAAGLGDPLGPD